MRRPGGKYPNNGKHHVPLPAMEMNVLLILLWWHPGGAETTSQFLAQSLGLPNHQCIHVITRRLRGRGLLKRTHFRGRNVDGVDVLFARQELTAGGRKIAASWNAFLEDIGPALRRKIGWAT
jgi:hypothetical protein